MLEMLYSNISQIKYLFQFHAYIVLPFSQFPEGNWHLLYLQHVSVALLACIIYNFGVLEES